MGIAYMCGHVIHAFHKLSHPVSFALFTECKFQDFVSAQSTPSFQMTFLSDIKRKLDSSWDQSQPDATSASTSTRFLWRRQPSASSKLLSLVHAHSDTDMKAVQGSKLCRRFIEASCSTAIGRVRWQFFALAFASFHLAATSQLRAKGQTTLSAKSRWRFRTKRRSKESFDHTRSYVSFSYKSPNRVEFLSLNCEIGRFFAQRLALRLCQREKRVSLSFRLAASSEGKESSLSFPSDEAGRRTLGKKRPISYFSDIHRLATVRQSKDAYKCRVPQPSSAAGKRRNDKTCLCTPPTPTPPPPPPPLSLSLSRSLILWCTPL